MTNGNSGNSSIVEFGFGENDEKIGVKGKRFKAKEGETYRVSFVWWPGLEDGKPNLDASTPRFIGCKRLYIAGVGYIMDRGPEFVRLAGGAASKMYVGTVICKWPTDSKGNLDKGRFASGEFEINSWVMSTDKYRSVETRHKEFPLGAHDVTLTCTDTQYQKIDISPCRESLFRKILEKDAARAKSIIDEAIGVAKELPRDLAQDLTLDQIREKLGKGGGASPVTSGGVVSSNSADFDGMLDDILK
jgi:hypothetical protein